MQYLHCVAQYLYQVVFLNSSHRHKPTYSRPKGSLCPFAGKVSPLLSSNR